MPKKPRFTDARVDTTDKAARGLWGLVELLLYRPSPRLAHGWRRMLLRLFGAKIGAGAHPYPGARVWAPWNLVMEPGSSLADGVTCYNVGLVHLGPNATVSQLSYLCTASRDIDRPGKPVISAPIHIAANAWVAVDCFIGPGVTIGENAVVGARSTVHRDVAANSVVAGSPPRLLRML
nr:putative colanic acid biosynthesis acetyltransferase [Polymorphobacter sp.]